MIRLFQNSLKLMLLSTLPSSLLANATLPEEQTLKESQFYDSSVQLLSKDEIAKLGKENWMNERFPINPNNVKEYIEKSSQLERSFKTNLNTQLIKRSIVFDPENAQFFPELTLSNGFDSVVTFIDSSGKPWPIEYFGSGNKNQFTVWQPEEIHVKNIIMVSGSKKYSRTTLTVKLLNEDNPIQIQLSTNDVKGTDVADARLSIHLQKRGPLATDIDPINVDFSQESSIENSNILLKFLDNLPPKEALLIPIPEGKGVLQAWSYEDSVYIRTKHNLIWPPALSVQKGMSGSKVYKTSLSPMIRLSIKDSGESVNFKVASYVN